MTRVSKGQNLKRDMIIIIIVAILSALFIWRYFDYKIVKIKSGYGDQSQIILKSITKHSVKRIENINPETYSVNTIISYNK